MECDMDVARMPEDYPSVLRRHLRHHIARTHRRKSSTGRVPETMTSPRPERPPPSGVPVCTSSTDDPTDREQHPLRSIPSALFSHYGWSSCFNSYVMSNPGGHCVVSNAVSATSSMPRGWRRSLRRRPHTAQRTLRDAHEWRVRNSPGRDEWSDPFVPTRSGKRRLHAIGICGLHSLAGSSLPMYGRRRRCFAASCGA